MSEKTSKALRKYMKALNLNSVGLRIMGRNNKTLENPANSFRAIYQKIKTKAKKQKKGGKS